MKSNSTYYHKNGDSWDAIEEFDEVELNDELYLENLCGRLRGILERKNKYRDIVYAFREGYDGEPLLVIKGVRYCTQEELDKNKTEELQRDLSEYERLKRKLGK